MKKSKCSGGANPQNTYEKRNFTGAFMKKMLLCVVMVLLLCSAALLACSKDKETESEKGAIEKMTDKTAKEIVDKIQAPIKSARSVKDQQEDRSREIESTLKEQ